MAKAVTLTIEITEKEAVQNAIERYDTQIVELCHERDLLYHELIRLNGGDK